MKKILLTLMISLMIVFLCGCGPNFEDTNGDNDISLATITEENIIKMDLGASDYKESTSSASDYKKFSSENFSGVCEIFSETYIKSDVIVDIVDFDVNSGNFKLVAVCDDKIIHEFEPGDKGNVVTLEDVDGGFSIRMAGESADFEFRIDVW